MIEQDTIPGKTIPGSPAQVKLDHRQAKFCAQREAVQAAKRKARRKLGIACDANAKWNSKMLQKSKDEAGSGLVSQPQADRLQARR